MQKPETLFQACKGNLSSPDCGLKYWNAWESGRVGAVAPEKPLLNPVGFCDQSGQTSRAPCIGCAGVKMPSFTTRVKNATEAGMRFLGDGMQVASDEEQAIRKTMCQSCPLNEGGSCVGCGCVIDLKTQARLETCPAGRWLPDVHKRIAIESPVRNIAMHLLPVVGNDHWKWNLQQIAARQHLFNGQRVLAISYEDTISRLATVTPDEVLEYSKSIGFEWTHAKAFPNRKRFGEVDTHVWRLEQVASNDRNESTFVCHGKGVTHPKGSITIEWAAAQYQYCLDDWVSVQNALECYPIVGTFRRFGDYATPGNHRWHYSGTNYWLRHDATFAESRDWRKIDLIYGGTEAWVGLMFRPEESACLFGDGVGNLYDPNEWEKMKRSREVWEAARI